MVFYEKNETYDPNFVFISLRYQGLKFLLGNVIRLLLISDDMNYNGMQNIMIAFLTLLH